ncbi:MAG: cupin domain-containing protein [Bacteroidales bacterium]|nr:cupin domain-containing protein [Bacteroidales bacterium]
MKKKSNNIFFLSSSIEWENLGGGVSRQIMGYDNNIMMVKVKFEKGAIGSPHKHIHSQTTYVAKGKFEFTVANQKQVLNQGDSIYFEPDILHSAICLEAGILIDVFSPLREDFLDGSEVSYFGNKV